MIPPTNNSSRDGYQWTPEGGLQAGIPTVGAIQPTSNIQNAEQVYDAIIIGAGYTGLTAARDLTITGHKVLLLEARDRIGGRSWSSNLGDYAFEMGGTWVHWYQGYVYREIARYNLQKQLEISPDDSAGLKCFSIITPDSRKDISHAEEEAIIESAIKKFINVDGEWGRKILPFPHDPHYNPDVAIYDKMSFADRFAQIGDSFTPIERLMLETHLSTLAGGTMQNASLFELLRWWALSGYDMKLMSETQLVFKFRCGQSGFARHFFDEALASKNLSYKFDTHIAEVNDLGSQVEIVAADGAKYLAKRAVSTIPLNVLNKVIFNPPLNAGKQAAAAIGHVNKCSKVHVECANPELRSFSGITPQNKLTYMFGDGTTPAGNTHLVSFGASGTDGNSPLYPEDDIDVTIGALKEFAPNREMDVKRVVFHNWHKDQYAKGTWAFLAVDTAVRYLDDLRAKQGNIFFASSDTALGWRSFIDGAIEDGTRAAKDIKDELAQEAEQHELTNGAKTNGVEAKLTTGTETKGVEAKLTNGDKVAEEIVAEITNGVKAL